MGGLVTHPVLIYESQDGRLRRLLIAHDRRCPEKRTYSACTRARSAAPAYARDERLAALAVRRGGVSLSDLLIIFTSDGHFALFQSRSELPKLAANGRAKATPEEAAAIVSGSIAYYGTCTINDVEKSLSVSLDGSTFENLLGGSAQKRLVTLLNATELQFANREHCLA